MNSANRSIAFVDYALRRRFYFIDFYPDSNVYLRWLNKFHFGSETGKFSLEMLNAMNEKIKEKLGREYQIGYSYFMINPLNYEILNEVVEYAIMPLIEQYYFGKKDNVDEIEIFIVLYLKKGRKMTKLILKMI